MTQTEEQVEGEGKDQNENKHKPMVVRHQGGGALTAWWDGEEGGVHAIASRDFVEVVAQTMEWSSIFPADSRHPRQPRRPDLPSDLLRASLLEL